MGDCFYTFGKHTATKSTKCPCEAHEKFDA